MTSLDTDPLSLLAHQALAGDTAALERLCRELQGPVFRLALRILGQPDDASDATQEVLVHVVTHLSQYRGESRVLTWVYTIATRHLLRSRKRKARERSIEVLTEHVKQGLAATEPSSAPEGEARVLERETRLGCTNAMLECLALEERMAIVLHELGADDALGAVLCEISEPTFRKRLSRARQKLKPVLEDLCGLAREDAPCTCMRQARAKQLASLPESPLRRLPVVTDAELVQTTEAVGRLRRMGPLFGADPPVGPPVDLWRRIREELPTLLGKEPS
ncbi:MAG: RNA polymerase sigma factor [Deltaproteobacteria bacterium]|nr:RNA polymerase sigma factor [Deltaproteobacteria bacterium]